MADPVATPAPTAPKSTAWLPIVLVLIVLAVLIGGGWYWWSNYRTETYTDDEGNTLTSKQKGDEVTVTDEAGNSLTVGESVAIPADFPKDVPRYKGNVIAVTNQADAHLMTIETDDSINEVRTWYRTELEEAGWTIIAEDASITDLASVSATKGDWTGAVVITRDENMTIATWSATTSTAINNALEQSAGE